MDSHGLVPIKIAYPKQDPLHFRITARACTIVIAPGLGNTWVTGRYYDVKETSPVRIFASGHSTEINVGSPFSYRVPPKFRPRLELSFGRLRPFSLEIVAGDTANQFDFGSFPLTDLSIQCGTGDQVINFSYPNPQLMQSLKVGADAGFLQIENIANAHASKIRIAGNATRCKLDFSGELQQNTEVYLGPDLANVEILIPAGQAAVVTSTVDPVQQDLAGFCYQNKAYWTEPALAQKEPLLRIQNHAGLGPFRLALKAEEPGSKDDLPGG